MLISFICERKLWGVIIKKGTTIVRLDNNLYQTTYICEQHDSCFLFEATDGVNWNYLVSLKQ